MTPQFAPPEHFSPVQRRYFADACANVKRDELRTWTCEAVGIASPVGGEAPFARYFVDVLAAGGLEASFQAFGPNRANAVARRRGGAGGPSRLLYAPFDMPISGAAAEDGPSLELEGRPDLVPAARPSTATTSSGSERKTSRVTPWPSLRPPPPSRRAGAPLEGDLIVGLGGGGMPVNATAQHPAGHGAGCAYMLEHGVEPDFAVIAKPGGAVAYEEVGLVWFKLTVHGRFSYAGIPPRETRNAVVDAATIVQRLQTWFPEYTARNTSGLVAPLGTVTAIAGGWPEKPAFLPDTCAVYVDLRISPRTLPDDAARQLAQALDAIRASEPGIAVDCEPIAAIPGTSTDPDNWIVRSSIAAWEATYRRPHVLRTGTSGATDANILRGHGIPTARIGMPALGADAPFAGLFSMGVVSTEAMLQLTAALIAIAIDTCTRTRGDVETASRKELSQSS